MRRLLPLLLLPLLAQEQPQSPPYAVLVGSKRLSLVIGSQHYQVRLGPSAVLTAQDGELVLDFAGTVVQDRPQRLLVVAPVSAEISRVDLPAGADPSTVEVVHQGLELTEGFDYVLSDGAAVLVKPVKLREVLRLKYKDR